jgi:DNA repair protein RadD
VKSALRPHQATSIEKLRECIRRGKRHPMLQAPTGAGKTILAAAIVEAALAKNNRVAFTVPRISLVDQTVTALYEEGITDVGVIQAQHHMTDWGKPVQVCSVDTLASQGYPPASIVIVDEAHLNKRAVTKWMADKPEAIFIGLSATPWTKGLGRHYDALVQGATIGELIRDGVLCPFKVFAPARPDLTSVKTAAGDFNKVDLGRLAASDKALRGDVVETWMQMGKGRPTICFAVDCAHGRHLHECFRAAEISAAYVDARTPQDERREIERDFEKGRTEVVVNVDVLGIGVDWDIRCIILARPTKSRIRLAQNIGRGMRPAKGKDYLLVLDHSDSHLNLGFVTDFADQGMDDGKQRVNGEAREAQERLPRRCKQCHLLLQPAEDECPQCGTVAPRRRPPDALPGTLTDFDASERERQRLARKERSKFTPDERTQFYAELLGYGREKGYKDGWAANKYREKFHCWPGTKPEAATPSPVMRSWIKSRQIAWAKSKNKNEVRRIQDQRSEAREAWNEY